VGALDTGGHRGDAAARVGVGEVGAWIPVTGGAGWLAGACVLVHDRLTAGADPKLHTADPCVRGDVESINLDVCMTEPKHFPPRVKLTERM
jgi:hypothetical protein